MFGMSLTEIMIIAIIAIMFLGPDKLPDAMVKIAKFFKSFKSSVNEVKDTFTQEVHLQELKDEANAYKQSLTELESNLNIENTLKDVKDDIDDKVASINHDLNKSKDS
jgi:sec-independent protein translocase protein TatB